MTSPALDLFDTGDLDQEVAEAVRRIAIGGFWVLWRGETRQVDDIVDADPAALAAAVDHLQARGRIEVSPAGELIGVHGLTRRATPHRIEHAGGKVNTWCALDAVGIPVALAIGARSVTRCPTCERQLTVAVVNGEPDCLAGAVLWYPDAAGSSGHLVDDFCSGANLFCDPGHLRRRVGDARGAVLTVQEVTPLGREAWADVSQSQ
jgi:hypothetical protein